MIFHRPDPSFSTLAACQKRAASFAKPGDISSCHPLAAAWSNAKMMIDADDEPLGNLIYLDWFASRLEDYSKRHLLKGDDDISAMLYEWQERMPINACKL